MAIGEQELRDVLEAEERSRKALEHLLEQQNQKAGHHFALRSFMGKTSSYVTTVSLDWVEQRIRFAADLPIFKSQEDEEQNPGIVEINADIIETIQQRQPDWRRQLPMACYLATREHHKFPPLLVVGYQGWVYEPESEEWGPDQVATRDSITANPLESGKVYYDLDDRDTYFYALDGQHRLMAIMGLKTLIAQGQLFALDQRGRQRPNFVTRDEIIEHVQKETRESNDVIHERLQRLMSERVGIEIIPAVAGGESFRKSLLRLRQVFVDVNEHAKTLTKSELTQLDETNGFRVVGRRVMVSHPLLKGRIDHKATQLGENSPRYTTLNSLSEIAKKYLMPKDPCFHDWDTRGPGQGGGGEFGYLRPHEEELEKGKEILLRYFEALRRLPSHSALIEGRPAKELRREDGEDNILFRPIVQVALASAISALESDDKVDAELETLIDEIARREQSGELRLRDPGAPWFGVLCDPTNKRMRRHKSSQDLCDQLFQYLLGGGISNEDIREKLRSDFADARSVGQELSINLEGERVPTDQIRLPIPWRW